MATRQGSHFFSFRVNVSLVAQMAIFSVFFIYGCPGFFLSDLSHFLGDGILMASCSFNILLGQGVVPHPTSGRFSNNHRYGVGRGSYR